MKKLIFIISVLILTGCSDETRVPKDIIPMDKMTSFLIDYHIAEQEVGKTILSYDSAKYLFHSKYYPDILEKHEMNRKEFERSIQYYTEHLNQFQIVYQGVEDSLRIKFESLENKEEK